MPSLFNRYEILGPTPFIYVTSVSDKDFFVCFEGCSESCFELKYSDFITETNLSSVFFL